MVKTKPKIRRQTSPPPAFLTPGETERLMAVIQNPRDRAIFSLAYHRGLRASEIGMLEMRDYIAPNVNERVGTLYCRRLKDSFAVTEFSALTSAAPAGTVTCGAPTT